jgi:hypothetical protein
VLGNCEARDHAWMRARLLFQRIVNGFEIGIKTRLDEHENVRILLQDVIDKQEEVKAKPPDA